MKRRPDHIVLHHYCLAEFNQAIAIKVETRLASLSIIMKTISYFRNCFIGSFYI